MNAVQIIKMATRGNVEAERFCQSWVAFCHTLDDCFDRDKPIDDSELARVFVAVILEVAGNTFFLTHKSMLVSLMVQSANAWVDSNHSPNPTERDVLKGMWHEVIFHVAFIIGGWSHMRYVTAEGREYDYEKGKT